MSYYEETKIAQEIRDAYERFKKGLYKPKEPDAPKPEKPIGDYIKNDGAGWGANQNPNTWKPTKMRDDPSLWKIVDDDNVNVAHKIETEDIAEQFIAYYKSVWEDKLPEPKEPEPEPQVCPPNMHWDAAQGKCVDNVVTPEPPTGEGAITKDGVKVPIAIKGSFSYEVREDWRDGGARFNMKGAGTSNVMIGYFKATKDNGDEVSAKDLMGRHTGEAGEPDSYMGCGYDLGCPVGGGKPRMRAECPHPKYTSTLKNAEFVGNALSCVGVRRGYMLICQQEPKGVRLTWYQDQGDCETKPANQWVKIYEFFDDGKINKISDGDFEGDVFPIRNLNHTKGTAQCVWRIDDTPGLAQKWLAVAETNAKN